MLVTAGVLTAIVSCGAPPVDPRDYENPERPLAKINVNDEELAKAMGFRPPVVVRDEDGFINRVEVVGFAEAANTLKVDYRPVFVDQNGAQLTPAPTWQTRFIEPSTPERFLLIPNSPHAVDYELHIRWSH